MIKTKHSLNDVRMCLIVVLHDLTLPYPPSEVEGVYISYIQKPNPSGASALFNPPPPQWMFSRA